MQTVPEIGSISNLVRRTRRVLRLELAATGVGWTLGLFVGLLVSRWWST